MVGVVLRGVSVSVFSTEHAIFNIQPNGDPISQYLHRLQISQTLVSPDRERYTRASTTEPLIRVYYFNLYYINLF